MTCTDKKGDRAVRHKLQITSFPGSLGEEGSKSWISDICLFCIQQVKGQHCVKEK